MAQSLKFGTSGLRGLAHELAGAEARRYTAAFIGHLKEGGAGFDRVFIGHDLRDSSPAITAEVTAAVQAAGLAAIDCGPLPTPALALHAMATGAPAIMVTGSHIPADRNGLKFYSSRGEITKEDEAGIVAALSDVTAAATTAAEDGAVRAWNRYRDRYRDFLEPGALSGWRLGVFEHSSVARDYLVELLSDIGAKVVRLGRSDSFVPVDTEALADPAFDARHYWLAAHRLDGIVSTDADGDRPLLIDAAGDFVCGDVLGLVAAAHLGADTVVTPVTSNSGIEDMGVFRRIRRTRVGSPHVIAAMQEEARAGSVVVGFEANGGTLLGSEAEVRGRPLAPLLTRDAVLPLLATLGHAASVGQSLAELVAGLPLRVALSDRLTDIPSNRGVALAARLAADASYRRDFFSAVGEPLSVDETDGSRVALAGGDIVHYRASGNAPELRCYVESQDRERAEHLLRWGLGAAAKAVASTRAPP